MLRSIALLNYPVLHNDYTIGHRHSLGLVVSNVNKCGSESLMQFRYLGSHLSAKLSVKVRKRLVKKEDLRFADYRSTESDTLSLTS